jgi:hypothetical protein
MLRSVFLALLLNLSVISAALAAGDHHHKGKHGGTTGQTSGHHHVELVTEGQSMTLYVLHGDGELENVADAKATATILSGGKTEKIVLMPDGEVLKGKGNFTVEKGDTIVITLTMPGHKPEQAHLKVN